MNTEQRNELKRQCFEVINMIHLVEAYQASDPGETERVRALIGEKESSFNLFSLLTNQMELSLL